MPCQRAPSDAVGICGELHARMRFKEADGPPGMAGEAVRGPFRSRVAGARALGYISGTAASPSKGDLAAAAHSNAAIAGSASPARLPIIYRGRSAWSLERPLAVMLPCLRSRNQSGG